MKFEDNSEKKDESKLRTVNKTDFSELESDWKITEIKSKGQSIKRKQNFANEKSTLYIWLKKLKNLLDGRTQQ